MSEPPAPSIRPRSSTTACPSARARRSGIPFTCATGARIGRDCIIGEKTYIAADVVVGDRCKINGFVYVCRGVTIEDGVMVGANVTFTNDRFPRATTPELDALRPSDLEDETLRTLVREGATIGAGATIGNDLVIGRFAMIGMGSVVTRAVPDFALVAGNPARSLGYVCRCGTPVHRGGRGTAMPDRARARRAAVATSATRPEDCASQRRPDDPGRSSGATRTQCVPR